MLQTDGPISIEDINVELGRSATAPFDFDGAEERALAGVSSGAIGLSDFYGKANVVSVPVDINTSTISVSVAAPQVAVAQFSIVTDGTITRTSAFSHLWVSSSDQASLDSSLYRCRLTKTSGNSNEGALFLDQWRTLEESRTYTIANSNANTTDSFIGVLRIEEIADSNNFETVTVNLVAENNGDVEPF